MHVLTQPGARRNDAVEGRSGTLPDPNDAGVSLAMARIEQFNVW
jgi:hypothetical protein